MKKIVTVIAVCFAIIMAGTSINASATKATTDKIVKKTIVTDKGKDIVIKNGITASDLQIKKTDSKTGKNSKVSKTKKTNATAVSEKKKAIAKSKANKYSDAELKLMTCIIYCEARGESYAGQMAVGIVVMNRKRSEEFPNGIKKVIYQKGQFTPAANGGLNRAFSVYDRYNKKNRFGGEMKSCYKAAKEVLSGTTKIRVNGKEKEMKDYLYFSQHVTGAKYTLGGHQFK